MLKQYIFLGLFVGSTVGGYVPVLFGVSYFSIISIFTTFLGGALGIYIGYKIGSNY